MSGRPRRFLVTALSAALLAASPVGDAIAKKPKTRFTATVNGKRLKAAKVTAYALYATTSFSVNGQTKLRKGVSRFVSAVCLGDLRTLALPATLSCLGIYTEEGKVHKTWQRQDGMVVTVESFDGSRTAGTFQGTVDPDVANASEPPAVIENGRFSLVVRGGGV